MYRKIIILFTLLVLLISSGCSLDNDAPAIINYIDPSEHSDMMMAVLNNKKAFITEAGVVSYLDEYTLIDKESGNKLLTSANEYVFIDLDGDTIEELLINISPNSGIYLILYSNGYDIFAYETDNKTMSVIKADGSFLGESDAYDEIIYNIFFVDQQIKFKKKAYSNRGEGVFVIDEVTTSSSEFDAFLETWGKQADIVWSVLSPIGTESTEIHTTTATTQNVTSTTGQEAQGPNCDAIDLNKYISIEYSGWSGAGTASISLDKNLFLSDNSEKIRFINEDIKASYSTSTGDYASPAEVFFSFISTISLSEDSNLKNSDNICIKWNINTSKLKKYFSIPFTFLNENIVVSGLSEPKQFNPMEYISVTYSGTAPCGQIMITADVSSVTDAQLANAILKACNEKNYSYDPLSIFQPGNSVNIIYTPIDPGDKKSVAKYINKYGLLPTETQKTFELTGFSYYPTKLEQIGSDIYTSADLLCAQKVAQDDYLNINQIIRTAAYYLTPTASEYSAGSCTWSLYVAYQVNATAEFWNLNNAPAIQRDITYYYIIEYPEIYIDAKGALSYNKYSTIINPVGRNGGAGFMYWEAEGTIYDTKPLDTSLKLIEHYCYPDGFATIDEIHNLLYSKSGNIEIQNFK